jgi:hypothetical protein
MMLIPSAGTEGPVFFVFGYDFASNGLICQDDIRSVSELVAIDGNSSGLFPSARSPEEGSETGSIAAFSIAEMKDNF